MNRLPLLLITALTAACSNDEPTLSEPDNSTAGSLSLDLCLPGALTEEVSMLDCTLTDGTETRCYEITVAGYPTNHNVGPFCPQTTAATAEVGGIWFDGDAVYDIDGPFILGLADLYNDSNWKLYDDDGNVYITDTPEAFAAAARPDVDPEYRNYCVEGRIEWLENGEPVPATVLIPATPVGAGRAIPARGNLGVTLNGVIIAAPAPVDAILGAYTIAAFDDCGGHINPFEGYHLHGARGCSEVGEAVAGETPVFAYALDGYSIHSPYGPASATPVELDQCNGHSSEPYGYHYHAAPAEENGVLKCFMGLTAQARDGELPGRGNGGPPAAGPMGAAPDFAAAAETLGVTAQELQQALGGPPPEFAAAARTLGVSIEALQAALGGSGEPQPAIDPRQ